jgi:hypothetical protein
MPSTGEKSAASWLDLTGISNAVTLTNGSSHGSNSPENTNASRIRGWRSLGHWRNGMELHDSTPERQTLTKRMAARQYTLAAERDEWRRKYYALVEQVRDERRP